MHGKRFIRWVLLLALVLAGPAAALAQVRTLQAVSYAGKRYVALNDLAKMYGLPMTEPKAKTLLIRGQYISLQFTENGRRAHFNGSLIWLHAPVIKVRGKWSLSDADATYVVDPVVRPSAYLGERKTRTVVLDPGHGGKDPGAQGRNGTNEKTLVLDMAKRVKAHLAAAGVRVVMTRDTDRFWTLKDRPYLAARGGGDVFVSIHMNSAGSRSVQGIETFIMPAKGYPPSSVSKLTGRYPASPNNRFNHSNMVLGNQIQRAVIGITRAEDRGLKRARFAVLKDSAMPAALIECGFLSNPQEEKKLATPSYRETLAQGIAQGILNFLAMVNRAKVEMGAPLIQAPTRVVQPAPAPAPAPAAPTPMAARAWGPAAKPEAPAPVAVAAPAPAPVSAPPAMAENEAPAPAPAPKPVAKPAPMPVPPPPPRNLAIAPPPSSLLNPNLVTRGQ